MENEYHCIRCGTPVGFYFKAGLQKKKCGKCGQPCALEIPFDYIEFKRIDDLRKQGRWTEPYA